MFKVQSPQRSMSQGQSGSATAASAAMKTAVHECDPPHLDLAKTAGFKVGIKIRNTLQVIQTLVTLLFPLGNQVCPTYPSLRQRSLSSLLMAF